MKAIEILDAFIREGISTEQSGIFSGETIIREGAYRLFGYHESCKEIRPDCYYLYYYGCDDDLFCFLPMEHIMWVHVSNGDALHLWEIEN